MTATTSSNPRGATGKSPRNAAQRVANKPTRYKSASATDGFAKKNYGKSTDESSKRSYGHPSKSAGGSYNRSGGFAKKSNFKSGPSRGPQNPQQNRTRNRFKGAYINPAMFINKAIIAKPRLEEKVHTAKALFTDLKLNKQLQQTITKRGYQHPTDIQAKTIPHILEGKDVIGLANTGTGKTGAFLLPMINKIMGDSNQKLLVMVPTRELAIQIQEEFIALTQGINIQSVVVVGGANIRPQIQNSNLDTIL